MRYPVLATDYDGTLAERGHVDEADLGGGRAAQGDGPAAWSWSPAASWRSCSRSARGSTCSTGSWPRTGRLLYRPGDRTEEMLGPRPPDAFLRALMARGVGPISAGRVIVATWEPHREAIEEAIRELGLDLRVIPNKRALMVLPPGVDKASGLARALGELGLLEADAVGVGDAENDLAMLEACGLGVAVANALPTVKERADLVTRGERGAGVAELIGRIIDGTLPEFPTNRNVWAGD